MEGFVPHQTGKAGDITAGLPPQDYTEYPYIEWYGDSNGRVVVELEANQIDVIGTPIPATESSPISRDVQMRNVMGFLSEVSAGLNVPIEGAVCVSGDRLLRAQATEVLGMELMPKEVQEKLPPLYVQEQLGGRAVVHVKYFTPDGSWTWYATEFDGKDTFFGLVDGNDKELGYFSLSELREARGPMGLHIERDLHWTPKTLKEIAPELFEDKAEGGEQ